jgi:predicted dehydrogenase/threonine dehydrogenase-like Zn-dependent dehydrogenase
VRAYARPKPPRAGASVKQVLQNLGSGITEVAEVPAPAVSRGQLLIRTSRTVISAGTERMLLDFGKASLLGKARQQPQRLKSVLDKVRTDGLWPTIDAVRSRLDQPLAMGYSNVGVVADIGDGVTGFSPGDRVASNGTHAEYVTVPANLCARVPDAVDDDAAAFTVIGAIALQGIRLVQPSLGEAVVVTGLGLVGLMTVQLLRAHGCRVLGVDFEPSRLALARQFGADTVDMSAGEDPVVAAQRFSRGRGVDAVIVAAATTSSEPMRQAALMCRQRGRIVLVGVAGLELAREDFFRKELTFQVSCSYGPGRHDPSYEDGGHDYPVGFVRWTEQRNFEAVLDMMADGRLDVRPLITHRFGIASAGDAYALISGEAPSLGVLLEFPHAAESAAPASRLVSVRHGAGAGGGRPRAVTGVGFIGAGNYATAVLIPAFRDAGAHLVAVASQGGVTGLHAARTFGFQETTTDSASLVQRDDLDALVIATRHDSHAALVTGALAAGKHVFVEKPLCMTMAELLLIQQTYAARAGDGHPPVLMVGFNRRFAPHVQKIASLLAGVPGPRAFVMTVNAGAVAADHWTQDPAIGGGRILGEGCHFIDLLRYLSGAPITEARRTTMAGGTGDSTTLDLRFADGSIGTVHYFANGSRAFPKERLEVFAQGRVLQLDNFRRLRGFGWPGFAGMNLWRQDKGQRACAAAFVAAVQGGTAPIPFDQLVEVARVTIELAGQR